MYYVIIDKLQVLANVGIHSWELKNRQPIVVDLKIKHNFVAAATKNDISLTLDYERIATDVINICSNGHFNLIENIAISIESYLKSMLNCTNYFIQVAKPEAIKQAHTVSVVIDRRCLCTRQ